MSKIEKKRFHTDKINLQIAEEKIWCVHKYLDDLNILRGDEAGEYSIVGRIKELEKRHATAISILETSFLRRKPW